MEAGLLRAYETLMSSPSDTPTHLLALAKQSLSWVPDLQIREPTDAILIRTTARGKMCAGSVLCTGV